MRTLHQNPTVPEKEDSTATKNTGVDEGIDTGFTYIFLQLQKRHLLSNLSHIVTWLSRHKILHNLTRLFDILKYLSILIISNLSLVVFSNTLVE